MATKMTIDFCGPGPGLGLSFWTLSGTGGPDPLLALLAMEFPSSQRAMEKNLTAVKDPSPLSTLTRFRLPLAESVVA